MDSLDPNSPNFPLRPEYVQVIRALMLERDEESLKRFLRILNDQNVPPMLMAIILSFTMETLPEQLREFWKPIAPNWEGALPDAIKDALHEFIKRKEALSSLTDTHLQNMLRSSMTPERAALLRSKAHVN